MKNYKILAIIANHTTNIIKYNVTLTNLSFIKNHVTNIIIVDTKDEYYSEKLKNDIENDDKINNYFLIENDNYFDFGKWIYALKNVSYTNYDYILLFNDSIILSESIQNYFIYLDNLENPVNLYAYNDSTQIKYHYQSYFFSISKNIVTKFIDFFESKKHLINNLESLITNIELNMCEIDSNHDCLIKIANEYNLSKNLYWENDVLYQYLLTKNIFSMIKLKKIFDIQKEYKLTIYGRNIENFDYDFYKTYYDDLYDLSDEKLLNHFIEYGQYEGRKFNKIFNVILPSYYRDKLEPLGLLYFFDVPIDFDIFFYLKNNQDIKDLSSTDAVFHYINFGIYEGRTYNKQNNKNVYFNNNYLNILLRLNYIGETQLLHNLNNFNIKTYILLTNDLNNCGYMGALYHYLKYNINNNITYTKESINKILVNIDCNIYRRAYPELSNYDDIQILKHYINNNIDNFYKIPLDFDVEFYKKIYPDISTLSNEDIKLHYLLHGIKENRQYKIPDDFDYVLYKDIYEDLNNLNEEKIKIHYLSHGMNENRIYKLPSDFDPITYKKIYKELNKLTDNELKKHYLYIGHIEKKIYKLPSDFNHEIYKKIYKDLSNFDKKKLEEHYLYEGINENRIYKVPHDFNHDLYKKIYKDLTNLGDKELEQHYLFYGHNNNRIYKIPDDFTCESYKKLNNDLINLNNEQLKEHYILNGINENRIYKKKNSIKNSVKNILNGIDNKIFDKSNSVPNNIIQNNIIPEDFDARIYKNIYSDLTNLSLNELKDHYLTCGINEGRIYKLPEDFVCDIYKKINKDLQNLNNEQLKEHYLYNGINEKRKYKLDDTLNLPSDFDPINYKKINDDLKNLSNDELIEHYLKNGINEKRKYKLEKNNVEKNENKLPSDFDSQKYKIINNDLKYLSNEELIEHYLTNGIKEKRKYKNDSYDDKVFKNLPDDFDADIYKKINDDLKNLSIEELKKHYTTYGINEDRLYKIPDDFRCKKYKRINDDLKNLTDEELREHYILYGIKEKRNYK